MLKKNIETKKKKKTKIKFLHANISTTRFDQNSPQLWKGVF